MNLGKAGSKPAALPLGDTPTKSNLIISVPIKNMVRKERLELSHPKILEPKSSASTNSATSAFLSQKRWLEYQDLNLGKAGSKPAALPLGDTPTKSNLIISVPIKNMVRKERLELSHPKILEPKSSASTNSATSAI